MYNNGRLDINLVAAWTLFGLKSVALSSLVPRLFLLHVQQLKQLLMQVSGHFQCCWLIHGFTEPITLSTHKVQA